MAYFAHSVQRSDRSPRSQSEWEPLYTRNGNGHLQQVARLAGSFAGKFGAADWGYYAGLWHDLGKYSEAFQAYLQKENGFDVHREQYRGRVDHSTAGAQHANHTVLSWGRLLAYVIAGHHTGLPDATGGKSSLNGRLKKAVEATDAAPADVLCAEAELNIPQLSIDTTDEKRASFQVALFSRMIFSCLVDADSLATERFCDPAKSAQRSLNKNMFNEMRAALDDELQRLAKRAEDNLVSEVRQDVLAACRVKATETPGLFKLTVPTGGGKTLASLAFAIEHAQYNDLDRVIYAIPFTSIIEQTANVFRGIFEKLSHDIVVEHHSNFDPDAARATLASLLATENWDAPLIVTTNVQFFESLFAAQRTRCRKLHNIVGSVIILDEAQTLPVDLLRPCLAALRELAIDYRCSIVLCSATQPALDLRDDFFIGLSDVREIMPKSPQLYQRMKRVEIKSLGKVSDSDLAERLAEEQSFLVIVNTRHHAAQLCKAIQEKFGDAENTDGLFHLSTNLCGEHRGRRIEEIRKRLDNRFPCRVVSTQLIEAGVDVDFPVVYRALSGIDSIAQAAGRCNREGRRKSASVWVFEPSDVKLYGYLASLAASAKEVLPGYDDLLDPAAVVHYFELHYWKQAGNNRWDERRVMECFPTPLSSFDFNFRTAAERFGMIEDVTRSVFVPYGKKGKKYIEQLRANGPSRQLLRKLQRYSVGVYEHVYKEMVSHDVEELHDGYAVLINDDIYDEQLGLMADRAGYHDPESLMM